MFLLFFFVRIAAIINMIFATETLKKYLHYFRHNLFILFQVLKKAKYFLLPTSILILQMEDKNIRAFSQPYNYVSFKEE